MNLIASGHVASLNTRGAFRFAVLFVVALVAASAKSANAQVLFKDAFKGPHLGPLWQASLPNAPYRFPQNTSPATYIGAPNYSFDTLDGFSVIELDNTLNNLQRVGWSSKWVFDTTSVPSTTQIAYGARFNTLEIGSSTSIDQMIEIWLLDAEDNTRYDKVALSAPGYGASRVFNTSSSITDFGYDTGLSNPTGFTFESNTWYRLVLTGSWDRPVEAIVLDDNGNILLAVSLQHTLSSYPSGLRVGISQSMGFPNAPYPTDVAIDYVEVQALP